MAKIFATLVLLLACLFVATQAVPVTDVSATYVGVTEQQTSPTSERFAVSVSRVDDLVDDDGKVVAERVTAVVFNFDLKDDQLLVNNVPVALGISSITTLEAEILSGATPEEAQALEKEFDIGLVKVEVATSAESFPTDVKGISLRRITIWTRVIEIDGKEVVQIDAVEKVIEIKVTDPAAFESEIAAAPATENELAQSNPGPLVASDTAPEPVKKQPCFLNTVAQRIRHWWRCSSLPAKIFVSSASFTVLFALFFVAVPAIAKGIANRRHATPYAACPAYQAVVEEVVFDAKEVAVVDEEKRPLVDEQDQ